MANRRGVGPGEKASEQEIDQFNRAMRSSPVYQNFLKKNGLVDRGQGVRMSGSQRKALQRELEGAGVGFQKGMEIDGGGNLDTKGFNWKKWGPIIAAGAATGGLGLAGIGPAAGLFGAGGGSAAIPSLAAGIPSTAAQAFGPFAAAAGGGTAAATGAGAGMGLKSMLLDKGLDFGLGALEGALSDGGGGSRTRPAFEGTNVDQRRVLEHGLNMGNSLFSSLMASLASPRDLSNLMPSDPGGRVSGINMRPPTPFNFDGDFSKQPFSGTQMPNAPDVNNPLTPEQLRAMLGGNS